MERQKANYGYKGNDTMIILGDMFFPVRESRNNPEATKGKEAADYRQP